jgi:hypothetical protein
MALTIDTEELVSFPQAIERGDVTLVPSCEPQDVYAGPVVYRASNGWEIAVFNDANEWDYIEWVTSADGRCVNYFELDRHARDLANYTPSDDVAWRRYGIPGHMKFRCTQCGVFFEYGKDKVYRCSSCSAAGDA